MHRSTDTTVFSCERTDDPQTRLVPARYVPGVPFRRLVSRFLNGILNIEHEFCEVQYSEQLQNSKLVI